MFSRRRPLPRAGHPNNCGPKTRVWQTRMPLRQATALSRMSSARGQQSRKPSTRGAAPGCIAGGEHAADAGGEVQRARRRRAAGRPLRVGQEAAVGGEAHAVGAVRVDIRRARGGLAASVCSQSPQYSTSSSAAVTSARDVSASWTLPEVLLVRGPRPRRWRISGRAPPGAAASRACPAAAPTARSTTPSARRPQAAAADALEGVVHAVPARLVGGQRDHRFVGAQQRLPRL